MGAEGAFCWTEEAVTIARDLWLRESAAFIAEKLGCTRNAVIGKMHRLGAEKQRTVAKPGRAAKPRAPARPKTLCVRAPVEEAPVSSPIKVVEAVGVEVIEALTPGPVTFADLRSLHCRWVLDRADGLDTLFCGEARAFAHAWCAHHLGIVYPTLARRHG